MIAHEASLCVIWTNVVNMSFAPTMPNIVEVIGRSVELRRAGKEYIGLCPFHHEKTASFTVSEEKGFYHCFGCQEHGDVIEFIRRIEGVSFKDALSRLGIEGGVYKPKPKDPRKQRAAAILAGWMNQQHLLVGAMLRELSGNIAIAEKAGATTFVERFEGEFSILETLFDDLARPAYAAEFLELRYSIEAITAGAPVEVLDEFPPLTPEYWAYLQELVAC